MGAQCGCQAYVDEDCEMDMLEKELGDLAFSGGKTQLAIDKLDRFALTYEIPPPSLLNTRGVLYYLIGDYKAASINFDCAVNYAPECGLYFYNMGITKRQLGDTEGSLKAFREALRIDPMLSNGLYLLFLALSHVEFYKKHKKIRRPERWAEMANSLSTRSFWN